MTFRALGAFTALEVNDCGNSARSTFSSGEGGEGGSSTPGVSGEGIRLRGAGGATTGAGAMRC